MRRPAPFSWWKLTCVWLVLSGLMQVPAQGTIDQGGFSAAATGIVAATVEGDVVLAAPCEQVRISRPERVLGRSAGPLFAHTSSPPRFTLEESAVQVNAPRVRTRSFGGLIRLVELRL